MINLVKTQQFIQLFSTTCFSLKGHHHVEHKINHYPANVENRVSS